MLCPCIAATNGAAMLCQGRRQPGGVMMVGGQHGVRSGLTGHRVHALWINATHISTARNDTLSSMQATREPWLSGLRVSWSAQSHMLT